ncbi:MAG: FRG domain-containing protein [Deltaproteobacteria bacterium]|nr:FRG domain-containing protein [Deltaproteobacteria bacterium]
MKGQWIGRFEGDVEGQIIANIDDLGKTYGGAVFFLPEKQGLPASAAYFETTDKKAKSACKALTVPIDPITSQPTAWENIQKLFPGVAHSKEAVVEIQFEKNRLHLKAKTDLGTKVESSIARNPPTDTSDIKGAVKTWEEYKAFVSKLAGQKNIFRGQRTPWKLRTAFHRRGRYNLTRFLNVDIPLLYRHLSARTSHVFNMEIPNENGAFLNLVQHHGYPTPLLDWTYSPYVAAFFAFRGMAKTNKNEVVRVYIFDQERWRRDWSQVIVLNVPFLHMSIIEFLAIENERLIPQQSATTVTNIDDIESYVRDKEVLQKCTYLTAIDMPGAERNEVMQELSFMGITAGSMFPGLDGACEELRERMFNQ